MAPTPTPRPDIIEPAAPPETPVQPTPLGDPAGTPSEQPVDPDGGDVIEPGETPTELPPMR